MRAGQLDQVITLQAPSPTQDAAGQESSRYLTQFTCRAAVQPLRGREFIAASAVGSDISIRFRARYRPEIMASWRVVWRGDPYSIVGEPINVNGASREMELMCKADPIGDMT